MYPYLSLFKTILKFKKMSLSFKDPQGERILSGVLRVKKLSATKGLIYETLRENKDPKTPFYDTKKWILSKDCLKLQRLRGGKFETIFTFRAKENRQTLESEAYLCKDDVYEAELSFQNQQDQATLQIRVKGKKNQHMIYTYLF
jgi:hypothetical protein